MLAGVVSFRYCKARGNAQATCTAALTFATLFFPATLPFVAALAIAYRPELKVAAEERRARERRELERELFGG